MAPGEREGASRTTASPVQLNCNNRAELGQSQAQAREQCIKPHDALPTELNYNSWAEP